mgnify:CR=1 FL=1
MGTLRRVSAALGLILIITFGLSACAPPPPPPSTDLPHVTTGEGDVTYADTNPEIVDWVVFGSFAYNAGLGGCSMVTGGSGWTESFTRIDPLTVRVRLMLDWVEGDNGIDPYGCGVNNPLFVGLLDGTGTEVADGEIPLLSHT